MLIDGIHIPLTVPFTRDGESYLRKLEYNVGRYSLTPAAGLVALTAASEGAALSDEEIGETLRVIGASAAAEKVLVAAIARDSVRGALAIAAQAAAAGFDAVLLAAPPQWARLTAEEVLLFFRAVVDALPLPVMLSSDAGAQGYSLSVDMIAELARHRNVVGLYDDGRGELCDGGVAGWRAGCGDGCHGTGAEDANEDGGLPGDGRRECSGSCGAVGGGCCGSDAGAVGVRSAGML